MILCKFQRWEFITEKLWSKFPLLADKIEEEADYTIKITVNTTFT